jgi:hypothetical protein
MDPAGRADTQTAKILAYVTLLIGTVHLLGIFVTMFG